MKDTAPLAVTVEKTHEEALALAERARDRIAAARHMPGDGLSVATRAAWAAETMRMTTRLMHVIAWTLTRKAVAAGEMSAAAARAPKHRLAGEDEPPALDPEATALLPDAIRELVEASEALYERARRLDLMLDTPPTGNRLEELWNRIENESGL